MSIKRTPLLLCVLAVVPSALVAQPDNNRLIPSDYLRTNVMANIPWMTVGLHFGAAGILGADGEYSVTDHLVSTSILELSAAPLYALDPLGAWYGTAATSTLLAAEQYVADRYGTDSVQVWPSTGHTRATPGHGSSRHPTTIASSGGTRSQISTPRRSTRRCSGTRW